MTQSAYIMRSPRPVTSTGSPPATRGGWEAGALHRSKWVGPIQGLSLILRSLASQMSATKTPQGQAGPLQPQEKGLAAELHLQTLKGGSVQARGSSCTLCQSPQAALSQRVPTWNGVVTGQLSRGGAR